MSGEDEPITSYFLVEATSRQSCRSSRIKNNSSLLSKCCWHGS